MITYFGTTLLGDDAAEEGSGRLDTLLDDFGADSAVQSEPLFRGAVPFKAGRGNVDGKISFRAGRILEDRAAGLEFLADVFALVNTSADLTFAEAGTTLLCAGAILRSISRDSSSVGVRVVIRYQFELTSIPVIDA